MNLAIGTYFGATISYAVWAENYFTVPFLCLFVLGYYYAGLMLLYQDHREFWARVGQAILPARLTWRHAARQ